MSVRDEILNRLRQRKHLALQIGSWVYQKNFTDILSRFSQALEAAKGEVYGATNLEDAWKVLGEVLSELGAEKVVFNHELPLDKDTLESKYPEYQWEEASGKQQELCQLCLEADVGLTGAKFALAETGSIGIVSGAEHARMVSLIPPVHVILLSERVLVPDLISWEKIRPKSMPSQLVFISGPSKTADIEQTLVVGAHGPKRLIVIVYGET